MRLKKLMIGGILGFFIGIFFVYLPSALPPGSYRCGLEHLNFLEYVFCKYDIIAQLSCGNCINAFDGVIYSITRPLYGLVIGILVAYLINKTK